MHAKRKELEEQGIIPESLLTKENLEKWLNSGKTYQGIAREYVGVHENDISFVAKKYGLQSMTAKYKFLRRR